MLETVVPIEVTNRPLPQRNIVFLHNRATFCTCSHRRRKGCARNLAASAAGSDANSHGDLHSAFGQFINQSGVGPPLANRSPSHLLPPTAAVSSLMDALQRNDWPLEDAGVQVAWRFTKPDPGSLPGPTSRVCSWGATQQPLGWEEFRGLLQGGTYSVLLNCSQWEASSGLVFPSQRFEHKAVMAVAVVQGGGAAGESVHSGGEGRHHTFTFCLERMEDGALKASGMLRRQSSPACASPSC